MNSFDISYLKPPLPDIMPKLGPKMLCILSDQISPPRADYSSSEVHHPLQPLGGTGGPTSTIRLVSVGMGLQR